MIVDFDGATKGTKTLESFLTTSKFDMKLSLGYTLSIRENKCNKMKLMAIQGIDELLSRTFEIKPDLKYETILDSLL